MQWREFLKLGTIAGGDHTGGSTTRIQRLWIRLLVFGCFLFLIAAATGVRAQREPESASHVGNVVTDWSAIAQNAIVTVGKQPIQRSQLWMTLVHVAIYDGVMSITPEYEQFKVTPAHLRPASPDAAAVAAAHGVLIRLLPDQQVALDAAQETSLAAIPDGVRKDNGILIGEEVASRLLEIHDGVIPAVAYTPASDPGAWQPTPPAYANALLPGFARVTPFALDSPWQFRPGPPPALSSSLWTRDYNEVKALGCAPLDLWGIGVGCPAASIARTDEQTEIGRFYTEHAVTQYSRAFRRYAIENSLDLQQTARFFAMADTAILDSQIACWDAKYTYNFWRPVTAIRAGDTDGNPDTVPDPAWIGLAITPAHPEYPAAHGCWTSATATILEAFNGTNMVHFVLDSAITGTTHVFENTDYLRAEIINARVYGGMHYRNSVEVGATMGEQVAHWVADFFFRPKLETFDKDDGGQRSHRHEEPSH
jgi:hypothetical protein